VWDKIIYVPIAIVIGLVMGSFYNVLIYRLPRKISLLNPSRSFCPVCHHQLAWKDNIPVVSYILLKGKCRYCGVHISLRYPLIESLTAASFVVAVYLSKNPWEMIALWFFYSGAIVASAIDFEHMLIPDSAVIVTAIGGVLWAWQSTHFLLSLETAGGAFIAFLLIYFISRGGMGFGDVEFFGVLALFLTPFSVVFSLLIASVAALIYAVPQLLLHKANRKTRVPFGPFLAIGTAVAMFLNFNIYTL
jgi:leader peptidase (prepilin peptidase)/N-methyltransferase